MSDFKNSDIAPVAEGTVYQNQLLRPYVCECVGMCACLCVCVCVCGCGWVGGQICGCGSVCV